MSQVTPESVDRKFLASRTWPKKCGMTIAQAAAAYRLAIDEVKRSLRPAGLILQISQLRRIEYQVHRSHESEMST